MQTTKCNLSNCCLHSPSYNVLVGAHDRETQKQGQPEWYALSGYAQVSISNNNQNKLRPCITNYNIGPIKSLTTKHRHDCAIQHENWTNSGVLGFPNDVAVLTLNRDIDPANVYVDDVAVAPSGDEADVDFVGQQCKIIGWGQTSGISLFSSNLQAVAS